MARGGNTKRNLPPEKISELIRGNKDALQAQAAIGGNGKAAKSEMTMPPGMLDFDPKTGDFLPAPNATKEQIEAAKALRDQIQNGLTKAQPNNTTPLPTPTTPATQGDIRAELAASEAAEKAFKDYLQAKMDKSAFETEQAAEKAKQEAWERFVRGQQSAHAAATSASNPANSAKAKKDPKSQEPKGEEKKEAAAEKPWWQSGGSGPRFMFGGRGAGGEATMGGGAVEARAEAAAEGQKALLAKKQARKAASVAQPTPPPVSPSK
jgi:hypothetical protein